MNTRDVGHIGAFSSPRSVSASSDDNSSNCACSDSPDDDESPGEHMERAHADIALSLSLSLATHYVEDARCQRTLPLPWLSMSTSRRRAAKLRRSMWYTWLVLALILLDMSLVFWEDPFHLPSEGDVGDADAVTDISANQSGVRAWDRVKFVHWADAGLLLLLAADVVLGAFVHGPRAFFLSQQSVPAGRAYAFCIGALLAARVAAPFNVLVPLRPALLVMRSEAMRDMFATIGRTLPKAVDVLLLLFCLLALYAGVGCVLFRHEYASVVASADGMSSHGNFDHFASAFLTLFVLTTTENYPAVMMPTLNSGNPQTHVTGPTFFISFLVLVVFVLLPLLLAVVYDEWKGSHRATAMVRLANRYQALIAAFHVLLQVTDSMAPPISTKLSVPEHVPLRIVDMHPSSSPWTGRCRQRHAPGTAAPRDSGLSLSIWRRLLLRLQPYRTDQDATLMFVILDTDDSLRLDVHQFAVHLCRVLDRFPPRADREPIWRAFVKRCTARGAPPDAPRIPENTALLGSESNGSTAYGTLFMPPRTLPVAPPPAQNPVLASTSVSLSTALLAPVCSRSCPPPPTHRPRSGSRWVAYWQASRPAARRKKFSAPVSQRPPTSAAKGTSFAPGTSASG